MNTLLKALIAIVIGVAAAYIIGRVCQQFGLDLFYGWLGGVIVGLAYFLKGPELH